MDLLLIYIGHLDLFLSLASPTSGWIMSSINLILLCGTERHCVFSKYSQADILTPN